MCLLIIKARKAGSRLPVGMRRVAAEEASRCPLWVISGHDGKSVRCLLYPRKRTFVGAPGHALRARGVRQ